MVTQEEYNNWLLDPVTKLFFKTLHKDREELKELWASGGVENEEEVKGRCAAVASILNMDFEDLVGERND